MSPKRKQLQYLFLLLLFALFAYASAGAIYADSAAAPAANVASLTQSQLPATDLDCLPTAYSLEELVDCVATYMPAAESGGFVTPTVEIRDDWRTVAEEMVSLTDINQCSAITLPESLEGIYEVFPFTDAYNGKQYCVALEIEDDDANHAVDRGWGTFIVNPSPERYLSIDIPHSLDDNDTEKQGIAVFKGVGAHTFIMNGASRDANDEASPCQGGEKIADVAHCVDNFFFPTVVVIDQFHTAAGNSHTSIQFHGMKATNCVNTNIYLTHGSEEAPQPTDTIVALKASLLAEQPTWSVAVPGEAGKVCDKNGTNNVEGRYLNSGSEEAACEGDVDDYTGKFIHIEQHPSLSTYRNPAVWIRAIKNTFAPLTPPVVTEAISFQQGMLPDTSYAGAADTMIRAKYDNNNYGTEAVCEAAGDEFNGLAKEVLLRWNLIDIPAGSTIYGAEVTLNITDDTTDDGYYAYPVLRDWVESQATWNQAASGSSWQLPGAFGALDRGDIPVGRLTPDATGLYTFTLNPALVQTWFDSPSSNDGIIIANPANSNRLIFDCRETTTAANRPKLTIYYDDHGNTATPTPEPTPIPSPTPTPVPGAETIYVGFSTSPQLGGVGYSDEDIVAYDTTTESWSIYFDGSDVGLSGDDARDVDAFYLMDDGSLLLSFDGPTTIPNVGAVDAFDIIRFVPTSTGANTAGTFSMYLDGSDVLLDAEGENIVGIAMTPGGNLLITTEDAGNVGFAFADEDLLEFNATTLGENTSGTWSLYFDGSDVGLGSEDLRDFWVDETTNTIYFTLLNEFLPTGDQYDIFACEPGTLGSNTTCTGGITQYWDGSEHGITSWRPDSLFIQR